MCEAGLVERHGYLLARSSTALTDEQSMRSLPRAQFSSRISPQQLHVELVLLSILLKHYLVNTSDNCLYMFVDLRVVLEAGQDGHEHAESDACEHEALGRYFDYD